MHVLLKQLNAPSLQWLTIIAIVLCLVTPFLHAANPASKEFMMIHTDRNIYISGEYMHYQLYLWQQASDVEQKSGLGYLVLRNQHGVAQTIAMEISSGGTHGSIYLQDTLPSGYYELIGFTQWMRNTGEESFFRKTIFIANRFDRQLSVLDNFHDMELPAMENHSNKSATRSDSIFAIKLPKTTGRRQRVPVQLNINDAYHIEKRLSITVARVEALDVGNEMEINHHYSPEKILSSNNRTTQLYRLETNSFILKGSVVNEGKGEAGARVLVNVPGESVNIMYVTADETGMFHFSLPLSYSNQDIVFSVDPTSADPNSKILFEDKYKLEQPFGVSIFPGLAQRKNQIHLMQDMARVRIAYDVNLTAHLDANTSNKSLFPALYSKASYVIYPSNFTPFDDLQEIAREIIPFLQIRRSGEVYRARILSMDSRTSLHGDPVFFIDGVICHDINPLIYLNSEMINRIEVQPRSWMYGDLEFGGIVSIFSHQSEYLKVLPQLSVLQYRFNINKEDRLFHSPRYDEAVSPNEKPDLRPVLLWKPGIRLKNSQEYYFDFYTGDTRGEYLIQVRGLDEKGNTISVSETFVVE